MSADTGLRGLDLLDAAIRQIEEHPETWYQGDWRCDSGMCVAGWMCELAGARWLAPAHASVDSNLVAAEDDDAPLAVIDRADYGMAVTAGFRAERLLGTSRYMMHALDVMDDRNLFGHDNTLAQIKAMRDDLRAHAAQVSR